MNITTEVRKLVARQAGMRGNQVIPGQEGEAPFGPYIAVTLMGADIHGMPYTVEEVRDDGDIYEIGYVAIEARFQVDYLRFENPMQMAHNFLLWSAGTDCRDYCRRQKLFILETPTIRQADFSVNSEWSNRVMMELVMGYKIRTTTEDALNVGKIESLELDGFIDTMTLDVRYS